MLIIKCSNSKLYTLTSEFRQKKKKSLTSEVIKKLILKEEERNLNIF
jgi:hypothetical protein